MNKTEAYIKLSLLPEVGAVTARRLLQRFQTPENVFKATREELMSVEKIGAKTADTILRERNKIDTAPILERMEKLGAKYIHLESPDYPKLLKNLDDRPIGFYKIGTANLDTPSVAIVGTRLCSVYGMSVTRRFATAFARAGLGVVSGLARGVDTIAHTSSLESKGVTIAVLGCGADIIYPPENAELYQKIIDNGGAIISEFPLGTRADKQNFPIRNRIISGMSLATLVVESDLRGGSMITARNAAEHGRDVFAVPGRIDSPTSRGCHSLIRDGAQLASCPEDIIEELQRSKQFEFSFNTNENSQTTTSSLPKIELKGDEAKIFQALSENGEMLMDEIAIKTGLPSSKCAATLLMLEIKKLIKKSANGTWTKRI